MLLQAAGYLSARGRPARTRMGEGLAAPVAVGVGSSGSAPGSGADAPVKKGIWRWQFVWQWFIL